VRDLRVACEARGVLATNYYSPSPAERAGINWAPTRAPISAHRAAEAGVEGIRGRFESARKEKETTQDGHWDGRTGATARVIFIGVGAGDLSVAINYAALQ